MDNGVDNGGVGGVYAVRTDGGLVRIRPVRPEDLSALQELHKHTSQQSLYRRFFSLSRQGADDHLPRVLRPADAGHRAVVACIDQSVVGLAEYERTPQGDAELALLVGDDSQHEGIGTLLIEHLASMARHDGISHFVADVLVENTPMITVLQQLGYHVKMQVESGTVRVDIDLTPAPRALTAIDGRERAADAANLLPILAPRSIAVIGASSRPGTVGHEVLRNILVGGYTGAVYVVNPHHDAVLGVASVAAADLLPAAPDVAVVAVPADQVPAVVRACGRRGIRGVVLLTAGFGEIGASGQSQQDEIVASAHQYGMRLIGPNCLGLLNTDPAIRLNATFAQLPMTPGGLGLVSQSGALGIAVVAAAGRRGLGMAQFVSVGNKADVSSNDLLLAWESDDRVKVIALYLESLGNPRKFARIARRVAQRTPIIAIKAGRSAAGKRAGQSHTAAAAASDVVVDALFTQAGVIRVTTMEQMLDAARVLCDQPLPAGGRVAIIGNSGGPGILAADAAESAGLTVVALDATVTGALRAAVPSSASCQNPVDLGAAVAPSEFAAALSVLLAAPEVDAVLTVYTETAVVDPHDVLAAVTTATATASKPVIATQVGAAAASIATATTGRSLPVFSFPEPAAAALATAARYSAIRAAAPPPPRSRPDGIDLDAARRLIAAARATGASWLAPDAVFDLLSCYGMPLSPQRLVATVEQALQAAGELGYPLAVKLADPGVHKSELGGVRLGVANDGELSEAVADVQRAGTAVGALSSVLLQPMSPAGTEIIIGAVQHAQFGPVVMLGAGGILADLLADRVFRLAPLGASEALTMIGELRVAQLLDGYRGTPVVSRPAVAELVARIATLADDLPEVAELDLNPLIATSAELSVVDARIRVAPAAEMPDPIARQLAH